MLACGMDPKGVMAELTGRARRLLQGQGRLDAHVLQGEGLLRRPRHRRRQRAARRGHGLRQPAIAATAACASPTSATARPTRARSTRASTWRSCGSCPWSSSSRTTSTPWAPRVERSAADDRLLTARRVASTFPASRSTAWTCARCSAAGDEAMAQCARGQGPDHPGDADLPLSRPLHVRPGQVPHARGSAEDARGARPDRAGARRGCWKRASSEDELKAIDAEIRGDRQRRGRVRAERSRARRGEL